MLKKVVGHVAAACFGLVLLCVFSTPASAVDISMGTITANALKMREAPALDAKVLDTVFKGEKVIITGTEGDWYKVKYNSVPGFMFAEYIEITTTTESDLGNGFITGSIVNLRESPNTECAVLAKIKMDTIVKIEGIESGWYKITYQSQTGYIHADYLELAGENLATTPEDTAIVADAVPASVTDNATVEAIPETPVDSGISGKRSELVAFAKKYIGVRYVYGGSSPSGFDCSGFTSYVYKKQGFPINRTASAQLSNGIKVTKAELIPGDLVFFKSPSRPSIPAGHVGIYVGEGKFIHSPSSGKTVCITSLSSNYYTKNYTGARRIIS